MPTPAQLAALDIIAAAAVESERATEAGSERGVPAELSAAQCILESGWLTKAPHFNCFGIKAYSGCYGTQLLPTTEWFTGAEAVQFRAGGGTCTMRIPQQESGLSRLYDAHAKFATFATLAACFGYHARLLQAGRYAEAWLGYAVGSLDLDGFIRAIAPIYATAPDYAAQVIGLAHETSVAAAIAKARTGTTAPALT